MTRLLAAITVFGMAAGLAQPCFASPIQIAYVATDLPDSSPAEDLWEYRYFVSDFTFAADQGFSISFDPSLYAALADPPAPVNPDWDVLTFQPDIVLTSAGLYDALSLVNGASLVDPFVVTFIWLGGPAQTPGSQFFTVNAYDADGLLTELETGVTVPLAPTVPEPATALLFALGTAAAMRRTRHTCRVNRGRR